MKFTTVLISLIASKAVSVEPQAAFITEDASRDKCPDRNHFKYGVTGDPLKVANRTYDYVIAGGGLTGLTLANRLANQKFHVLVIESGFYGAEYGPIIDDLNTYGQIFGSSVDHAYQTSPQLIDNRVQIVRSGNGLGGSTLVNGGTWTRPHKAQVDSWSKVFQNTGWTWDDLFKYMIDIEDARDPAEDKIPEGSMHNFTSSCHNPENKKGNVKVGSRDRKRPWSKLIPALMHTVKNTYPDVVNQKDLCCGDPSGVSMFLNTLNVNQTRMDAARSWLNPILDDKKLQQYLTVLTGQLVGKVLLEENQEDDDRLQYKAKGVEFGVHNATDWKWNVHANEEVLLAAGSAISPLILQYSGIGPKDILEVAGIEQKLDLPVGLNLQDQTTTSVITETTRAGNGQGQAAYFATFKEVFGPDARKFETMLNDQKKLDKWADETVGSGAFHNKTTLLAQYKNYQSWLLDNNTAYAELFLDTDDQIHFDLWDLIPFTRGYVKVLDSDPYLRSFEYNPRYFQNELDLYGQAAASRLARNLTNTHDMASLAGEELIPGQLLRPDATLDEWAAYVKQNYRPNYHGVGTCSMMSREMGGVVNYTAEVYGVDGLRVVDGSIPPTQVSSHVMTVFYAMASKIADGIVQKYRDRHSHRPPDNANEAVVDEF